MNHLKSKELKFADNCFKNLLFSDSKHNALYFEKLLQAKQISKNIFENENSYFYVNIKSLLTSHDFIEANEFYLEQKQDKPLCFLCKNFDTSFSEVITLSDISYSVFTSNEIFLLMKSKNCFPEIKAEKEEKFARLKRTKSKFLSSLSRNHFKKFFLSGISLFLISFFVPFTSFYMIFGTIFLLLAIVCLFKKNGAKEDIGKNLSELAESGKQLDNQK